ncbi:MAG TPA: glycosyltransferase [Solirubrobacteraceae bacterium]|jgi:glycosyltransferase involved in cell wall biosynthesis|nr:glycosyltransferase [Solirubrobacteraceae bacterium]
MPRLLFIKSRRASFIELDERLLAERFDVHEIYQPGRFTDPRTVVRELLAADVVVGWWASWHTFLPTTLAWLLRKPSLLIVGGFDTAADPEYGYGFQLGGPRAWLSRFTMRRARILMTNSEYSRQEIWRNIGIPPHQVRVVYHGVPELASGGEKRPLALTVGIVDRTNLDRKGLRAFVEAAALVPEVEFIVVGRIDADAGAELERRAADNVRLTGWVEDEELAALLDHAAVYVQASKHEGFGVSVAEAMLARCVPVATRAGALPEVVGDTGVLLDDAQPATVALGVREALHLDKGEAARRRVLTEFSVEQRRAGLFALLDELV